MVENGKKSKLTSFLVCIAPKSRLNYTTLYYKQMKQIIALQWLSYELVKNISYCRNIFKFVVKFDKEWLLLKIFAVQFLAHVCSRVSGNDFCFHDIASHTGRFFLILVCFSSVVSFRVDIRQLSLFLICPLFLFN